MLFQQGDTWFVFPRCKLYSLSGFNVYFSEYEKNLTLKENKIKESEQRKNTPNGRTANLEQIAIPHTDPFYIEGMNFYLVHKIVLRKRSRYDKINSNLFPLPAVST